MTTTLPTAAKHALLTPAEREAFLRDGYFLVPEALPPAAVERFGAAADRIASAYRASKGQPETARVNIHDTIGRDAATLDLIDWPATFHKVWGLMGWNIHLYHTQLIATPPAAEEGPPTRSRLGWHQDNNHMNKDIVDVELQPMISLKVVYFLSDVSTPDRGNFMVVPGSHLKRSIPFASDADAYPTGCVPVRGPAGTAAIFDRRLWHTADVNRSAVTRKVLFYGYGYRWLKTKCDMACAHLLAGADPVRRQLLGAQPTGSGGCFAPEPEDVPLKDWIAREVGPDAVRA